MVVAILLIIAAYVVVHRYPQVLRKPWWLHVFFHANRYRHCVWCVVDAEVRTRRW